MDGTVTLPAKGTLRAALIVCVILAALVRLIALDRIPPGLWYDEAIYALDGLSTARGEFRIFYTTEGHPREPLFIYSLGAFFALFGHSVLKARLVGAIWGIATVALFYPVARRILPGWWSVAAVFAFALFRWHVHFSRTVFRALLPPFFILLVVLFFQRWLERRRASDAALCGLFLGLGMYTYLSFRLVPLLLAAWVVWLICRKQVSLRRDWKHLAMTAVTALLVFSPLAVDYVRNPWHFGGRMDEVSMFRKSVEVVGPDGTRVPAIVAKPPMETARDLLGNARDVALMWTVRGDHVGKHNLPYEPVFDWASGVFFYLGLFWCILNLHRNQYAFLLLTWLLLMAMTSVFSFGAPNILRMQGVTPAVILIFLLGLKWVSDSTHNRLSPEGRAVVVGILLLFFGAYQTYLYFDKFPKSSNVVSEFQKETFYDPAMAVRNVASQVQQVLVSPDIANHPSFRFITADLTNIRSNEALPPSDRKKRWALLVTNREISAQTTQTEALLNTFPGPAKAFFTVTAWDERNRMWRRIPWAELRMTEKE